MKKHLHAKILLGTIGVALAGILILLDKFNLITLA